MIVEVLGIFERNKGAVLMLEAVRAELKKSFPNAELAVPTWMSREARDQFGVLGVIPPNNGMRTLVYNLLPNFVLRRRGLVKASQVNVVLDASGFSYGDYWGAEKLRHRLLERLKGWKSKKNVAVLLPQALGSFEKDGIAEVFGESLKYLDRVFVRDNVSAKYVANISTDSKIKRSPDFTNVLKADLPAEFSATKGVALLIPNEKMATGDRAHQRDAYIAFMIQSAKALQKSGRNVSILLHEGRRDRVIADAINDELATKLPIVNAASALDTKAIIANADLIVSSRFHGLVSALSNGVPSLACGWSHKYQELMDDYGNGQLLVDVEKPETWSNKLNALLEVADSPAARAGIRTRADEQRKLTDRMWNDVRDLIKSKRFN